MTRLRLDAELVRRGLARSRDHAVELVTAGQVKVAGRPVRKAASPVAADTEIDVRGGTTYVSRGGQKLAGALREFAAGGLEVAARRCLDAGASTGGFTEVLLQAGAGHVVAVDVGHGQLAAPLRSHPAVEVHEGTNIRALVPAAIGGPVDLAVADLSFISLTLVLPALRGLMADDGDLVVLVKPQFEVGRERLGTGGVVREAGLRADAVRGVAATGERLDLGVAGLAPSRLPGHFGNAEYFLWLRSGAPPLDEQAVARAMAEGRRRPGVRA